METVDPGNFNASAIRDRLNSECFCMPLDRAALLLELERVAGGDAIWRGLPVTHPHLFANSPVFVTAHDIERMARTVAAIERVTAHPAYRARVLASAPSISRHDFGPRGVFMGYDFHVTPEGPKLIEINSNAGGAFLNATLLKAQRACCGEVVSALARSDGPEFDEAVADMFLAEWRLQRGAGAPARIAIVDDAPPAQYLFPDFLLAKRLLERRGLPAEIHAAADLTYRDGRVEAKGQSIDLVYNRLVDFPLAEPAHAALRAAYVDGAVVVTPNPHTHALFADKRNLVLLSDAEWLAGLGIAGADMEALRAVPRTRQVMPGNADELWAARRGLFFKPASGYGGKAVYRGDKLTRNVWAGIMRGGYIAQDFVLPSERVVDTGLTREAHKLDVRLYTYDGKLLLAAARLYQGQTTNFRTLGGGFAPVFAV